VGFSSLLQQLFVIDLILAILHNIVADSLYISIFCRRARVHAIAHYWIIMKSLDYYKP
jgi:hypothetical protein